MALAFLYTQTPVSLSLSFQFILWAKHIENNFLFSFQKKWIKLLYNQINKSNVNQHIRLKKLNSRNVYVISSILLQVFQQRKQKWTKQSENDIIMRKLQDSMVRRGRGPKKAVSMYRCSLKLLAFLISPCFVIFVKRISSLFEKKKYAYFILVPDNGCTFRIYPLNPFRELGIFVNLLYFLINGNFKTVVL